MRVSTQNPPRKKLLAVLGSPRKEGACARMLREAAEAAAAAGYEVETADLYALSLLPCAGCMACRRGTPCPLPDDAAGLIRKIKSCDALVLAAPTYWGNVPGPVKNLLDRLAGEIADFSGKIPRPNLRKSQRYLLLTACAAPPPLHILKSQAGGALSAMARVFFARGMRRMGTVAAPGTRDKTQPTDRIKNKIRRYFL